MKINMRVLSQDDAQAVAAIIALALVGFVVGIFFKFGWMLAGKFVGLFS